MNEDRGREPGRRGPVFRQTFVLVVTLVAAGIAGLFWRRSLAGLIYDSYHYATLSRIVSTEGLWNLHSRVRTYGYPLFISLCTGFSDPSPETTRALVFAAQLALYLGAGFYTARVAERIFSSKRFFFGTYLVMALDPIALARATELLSDLLSAVLILLAVLQSIEKGRPARRAFLGFLCAGLSAAVRPANVAILPVLVLVWLLRAHRYRERPGRTLTAGAAAVALALLPQLSSNVSAYGQWTPLLADRLYGDQVGWGMSMLKYGTLVLPGREPQLVYRNPFYPSGVASPVEFLRRRPLGYLATLGLHGFALVDQDFPFTYITNPKPRLRWPLSLGNYSFLYLAGLGLVLGLTRARERPAPERIYFAAAALVALGYLAIYLPVAVESRFSLPLYLILGPAAVAALVWLSGRRYGTVVAVVIAGGGFVAACVQLSLWLSAQAPVLVELARQ